MLWLLAIVGIAIIAGIFFAGNRRTKDAHAAFTKRDVTSAIENVLSDGCHDEWDLFLSWPIDDQYLESIRIRCITISEAHSGTEKGKDIASTGEIHLREILAELNAISDKSQGESPRA